VSLNPLLFITPNISADLYLDPGSGSLVLQLILAFLFGALFIAKTFRKKVKAGFYRLIGKKELSNSSTIEADISDKTYN
jgi:hypothetical protein